MNMHTPHINMPETRLIQTVLYEEPEQFYAFSGELQSIALELATEVFVVYSNPFVDSEVVQDSSRARLQEFSPSLTQEEYQYLESRLQGFWQEYQDLQELRSSIIDRLQASLNPENIGHSPHSLAQCSTDATGLIMELPLLVVFPESTEQVKEIILAARELGFFVVPRGGGSGLTGGAVPALRKSVVLSTSKLKEIFELDTSSYLLCAQSGVITLDAIRAAQEKELLFTVDPASKSASSLGGNIAENAGGPYAFEYGTTLDNLYSYRMVQPDGRIIQVQRKDHPWHKIYPEQGADFQVLDEHGQQLHEIRLQGKDVRKPGLGKDVTNKFLGGLPGVQKEGVDGIITEACFTLHPLLKYSQTLCLEFYGPSMHNAALVIKDLVHLRDRIREQSNLVTMSALEEFGNKYVRAVNYQKKSQRYEGEPISVLLIQLDSNNKRVLRDTVWTLVDIAEHYDNVDILVAQDQEQAAAYWEDRHRLSAISKKTSGFKINEDIVIPLDKIPEFSDFLESINLKYLSVAYMDALQQISKLPEIDPLDQFLQMEIEVTQKILGGEILEHVQGEQEFALQIHFFFQDLFHRYPEQKEGLQHIEEELFHSRLEIANHMHAGDGNCHVNIPVHANNTAMQNQAEQAVEKVFAKALELDGQVSGEHGIGITKIKYLSQDKIQALQEYKAKVDPDNILNPEKLSSKELVVDPYTMSWDKLIQDFSIADLPHKEKLAQQLKHIQICTRCGKCKQVCPMYYPEKGFLHHPRNKNISLGLLLEALLYTQAVDESQELDQGLLSQLQELMDYCTACGKCMATCPVKIDSAEVTINLRSYLERESKHGLGLKSKMLNYLGREPERIQMAAKAAVLGQSIQSTAVRFLPSFWRRRLQNPIFKEPAPKLESKQLSQILDLSEGNLFLPEQTTQTQAVIYFPGCGASLFYPGIALSSIYLLLQSGYPVLLPTQHKCCGYPLLSAGCTETFHRNMNTNMIHLQELLTQAENSGLQPGYLLTSCGTCRAALENYPLEYSLTKPVCMQDVFQFLQPSLLQDQQSMASGSDIVLHSSCHSPLSLSNHAQADQTYSSMLQEVSGADITVSQYCCAESGMGALTSPHVYNRLRKRKKLSLRETLSQQESEPQILVSCPSCKMGISRILNSEKKNLKPLHTVEFLAKQQLGPDYKQKIKELLNRSIFRQN
ncbi:MAG: FAD-binding and (Fe-S)-binding domain-containing protein [Desulfohalobiaceae bacterium]